MTIIIEAIARVEWPRISRVTCIYVRTRIALNRACAAAGRVGVIYVQAASLHHLTFSRMIFTLV